MQPKPPGRTSILAIEDDPNQMELLQLAIGELPEDISVITAEDGMEALHLLQLAAFDDFEQHLAMVLMDLRLPRMHGMDLLCKANEFGLTARVPFIVFTSSDSSVERDQAMAYGARDYLVKPLGYKPLKALILSLHQRWIVPQLQQLSSG